MTRAVLWRDGFALGGILVLAAALRLWGIERNSFGTAYYAAGVRSQMQSWHNFFFNAFDPAGFVSLDKPPVAFWLQGLSAWLLSFDGFALHLPQALEGVGAVLLLHHLVAKDFGPPAGLLAALFLALTPISVAIDRSTNTDSALVLALLAAFLAARAAVTKAHPGLLALAMALFGLGFNIKMMAAFVLLPVCAGAYALLAPASLPRRIAHLALAGVVLATVSFAWIAAFDLTPPAARPYAGSSSTNSMLELAVDHNALQRFTRPANWVKQPPATPPGVLNTVPAGPLRLFDPYLAGQVLWLLPLALAGLCAAFQRNPIAAALWGGWALLCAVVYSAAGGIFHAYYLAVLAPALAALAAIGFAERHRLLPMVLVATALWQGWLSSGFVQKTADGLPDPADWRSWLLLALPVAGIAALAALRIAHLPLTIASLAGLLAMPAAWAISSILEPGALTLPAASIARLGPNYRPPPNIDDIRHGQTRLVDYLIGQHAGERFLVAVPTARHAAPIIVATGRPVMAMGGYSGGDPILDYDRLTALVAAGECRFILLGGPLGPGRAAPDERQETMEAWVRRQGRLVPVAHWREPPRPGETARPGPRARYQLYDMRPATTGPIVTRPLP